MYTSTYIIRLLQMLDIKCPNKRSGPGILLLVLKHSYTNNIHISKLLIRDVLVLSKDIIILQQHEPSWVVGEQEVSSALRTAKFSPTHN